MRFHSLIFLFAVVFSALSAADRHIAILTKSDFKGELAFAHRVQAACKNINWEADIVFKENALDLKKTKYDFVIHQTTIVNQFPKCKNYLTLFHPAHHYFAWTGFLRQEYRAYDGYLLSYTPESLGYNNDFTNRSLPYIEWYPTVHHREFQIVNPAHLFFICSVWGNRLKDYKFEALLRLLDKEPHTRFYGHPIFKKMYPQSYQGEIPFDNENLFEVASEAGVTLVLHSDEHIDYGVPSGRIFEAAASSTVIICDQNPFVKENFGDSVLYIDTDCESTAIFNQIQSHMDWINNNTSAALEKAKRAHDIYKERFLLENQLLNLGEFHDSLSK